MIFIECAMNNLCCPSHLLLEFSSRIKRTDEIWFLAWSQIVNMCDTLKFGFSGFLWNNTFTQVSSMCHLLSATVCSLLWLFVFFLEYTSDEVGVLPWIFEAESFILCLCLSKGTIVCKSAKFDGAFLYPSSLGCTWYLPANGVIGEAWTSHAIFLFFYKNCLGIIKLLLWFYQFSYVILWFWTLAAI